MANLDVVAAQPDSVEERILKHAYQAADEIIDRLDGQLPADVCALIDALAGAVGLMKVSRSSLPTGTKGLFDNIYQITQLLIKAKDRRGT